MIWNNKGKEYDKISQEFLNSSNFYIWGAGNLGEFLVNGLGSHCDFCGVIDSDAVKQGKKFCGLPVISPEKVDIPNSKIIVAIHSPKIYREVFKYLEQRGGKHYDTFLQYLEFYPVYPLYKKNLLMFPRLAYSVTDYCTLNCKHCGFLVPYIKQPKNIPVNDILKEFEILFEKVDHIQELELTGGDSWCHPQICEIMNSLGEKYYKTKVQRFTTLTNAIIMPTSEMLETMKKYNITVRFSDYGKEVKDKQKMEMLKEILTNNGIAYIQAEMDTWLDFGYPQERNMIEEENLATFFEACAFNSCQKMYDGKLFFCSLAQQAYRAEACIMEENDYFDLFTGNKLELMEFYTGFSGKGYFDHCKRCNGSAEVNSRFIAVGKQLSH